MREIEYEGWEIMVEYAKEKASQAWKKLHPASHGKNEKGEKICTCKNCVLQYRGLIEEANGYTALSCIDPNDWRTNEDLAEDYYFGIDEADSPKIVWNFERKFKGKTARQANELGGDSDERPLLERPK